MPPKILNLILISRYSYLIPCIHLIKQPAEALELVEQGQHIVVVLLQNDCSGDVRRDRSEAAAHLLEDVMET